MPFTQKTRPRRLFAAALGLMMYQLVVFLSVTGGKLRELVHWDAAWYRDIAIFGYSVTYPLQHKATGGSNIGFFPAFPIWARTVIQTFNIDPNLGVALAAQVACVVLWLYFILYLRKLGVRPAVILASCFLFLIQPGAFYTIIGYSESLFIASILGFIYWSTRMLEEPKNKIRHAMLAVLHGGIMSSTRLVGVVLVCYPLLLEAARALDTREKRSWELSFSTSLLSLWGFLGFLVYCQLQWGHWDVHWEATRIGWGVKLEPWKIYQWSFYRDVFFFGNLSEVLGRLITVATLIASIALGRFAWLQRKLRAAPLALAALHFGFLYESIIGSHGMHSMVRYLVPIHALTLPLLAVWIEDRLKRPSEKPWPTIGVWAAVLSLAGFFLAIQILFAIRYGRNDWVS
ncbi:hypothetical protein WDW37_18875 [Bdellovibrionota bacterium FG-1]